MAKKLAYLFTLALVLLAGCEPKPRPAVRRLEYPVPATVTGQSLRAWRRFNEQHANRWSVKWNTRTGIPQRISGHYLSLAQAPNRRNIGELSLKVISDLRSVLQIDPEQLKLSRADFEEPKDRARGTGTWYVSYKQSYRGLPVEGGSAQLVIRDNRVTSFVSDFHPRINISPRPRVSREEAIKIVSTQSAQVRPDSVKLIIWPKALPKGIQYHLAWDLTMPVEKAPRELVEDSGSVQLNEKHRAGPQMVPVQWRYLVDAHAGEIIKKVNLMWSGDVNGNVTGMVIPKGPGDTPESRPIRDMTVTITQGSTTATAETTSAGDYTITGLADGTANLEAHLVGPHIRVHNQETADPDATHAASVTAPGTHNWNWAADDPSPSDAETSAFWHVNYIRNWFLRGSPFDVSPLPDPMEVYVRDGEYCNAYAGPGGLRFGSGSPGSCQDFSLCADIVYHEYTHRIVHKVYDDAGVSLPYSGQTGAMNEGWSDYFGSTNTNDSGHGKLCYTGRDIDTPDKRFDQDWAGAVHQDGLIFSGALWDLRKVLEAEYVDAMALRAMKQAEVGFSDYLEAVLEEDDDPMFSTDPAGANNNPADGTPNIDAICNAYYDLHGVFHTYCGGHTQGPVAVIRLPDPMSSFNLFDASATVVPIEGTALGSMTSALQNYVIEYARHDAPSTWLTAGVTLVGGGTTPVSDAPLGQINLAGLADGFYLIRLTVTAADTSTASASTTIVLDRLLRPGWPAAPGVHFYGAPAVADIDPTHPGLEVVAAGDDYKLHVWYADGTAAAGWPQNTSWTMASPAVADLDGDGSLEIIIATSPGKVYAFSSNGTPLAGWPKLADGQYAKGTTAIADLDGDGDLEVVVGIPNEYTPANRKIYAWHHDGSSVAGWPISVSGNIFASPSVGDLDGNGSVEVVVGADDGKVHVWHGNGTTAVGWPKTLAATTEVTGSVALGDLDDDGDLEIVVGTLDFDDADNQKAYAWHHDGTSVTGWPQSFGTSFGAFQMAPSSTVLADLDGDGDIEVIIMSNNDRIHVWQGDGTPVAGWPPAAPGGSFYEFKVSTPAVADIDGDGDMEVVAEAWGSKIGSTYMYEVYALHHDATLVAGWPKAVSSHSNSPPTIADIDQDGDVEILVGSDGVFIWDLPGAFTRGSAEWSTYRDDNRRTGTYGPKAGLVLLFDTSGSMSWLPDGTYSVPPGQEYKKRLNLAKEAVYPLMEMLNDHGAMATEFGIATFPSHPSLWPACLGQVVTPMTLVTTSSKNTAMTTTIPGLTTENNTPLLAGVKKAADMFGISGKAAIVLLSDGYHNCPSLASVGSPEVTELINHLQSNAIRVFTIGFGRPTDVDHPLLEALASETEPAGFTGTQFYDVTTPGFDPDVWTPATALQSAYKSILVDAMDLDSITDPLGLIRGGARRSFKIPLNEHDRRVTFYLSWETPQEERLELALTSSDGSPVPMTGAGVRFHQGNTHAVLTVDRQFLSIPGKISPNPWIFEVIAGKFRGVEHFQYSVIVDSGLKLRASVDRDSYSTGDTVTITAAITEAGSPLKGLTDVRVVVSAPEDGQGNWLVKNKVSAAELAKIPVKLESEPLLPFQRKARYLTEIRKVPFPGHKVSQGVRLYDDGTHGDKLAGDGVYTNRFSNTKVEGVYSFHVLASGGTKGGNRFHRDRRIQKYVTVKVSSIGSIVDIVKILKLEAYKYYDLAITPRDAFGNYLGPGHANVLSLRTPQGRAVGSLVDNFDGTYGQRIEVAKSVLAPEVILSVLPKTLLPTLRRETEVLLKIRDQ